MCKKTAVEVYFALEGIEPTWDFSLSKVTEKLGVLPTETKKQGERAKPLYPGHEQKRHYSFTEWKYSTGKIETLDFDMVADKIVQTFKDKVDAINELKQELQVMARFCAVTYVEDGMSPGYSFPLELMQFAIDIGIVFGIDQYVSGFVEEEIDDVL